MTTVQGTSRACEAVASLDGSSSGAMTEMTSLPDPDTALAMSGDPGAELAALMVKNGTEQRQVAQTQRDTQENIEAQEDSAEVSAMRQKADDIRSAGWAEGATMMVQGASGMIAAGVEADAPMGDAGAQTRAEGAGVRAAGTMVAALGTVDGAAYRADAAGCDASAASHKAAADRAHTAADDAKDAKKGGDDLIAAALDFYKDYVSNQSSERGAALHRA
jgi:hypothetical protein